MHTFQPHLFCYPMVHVTYSRVSGQCSHTLLFMIICYQLSGE